MAPPPSNASRVMATTPRSTPMIYPRKATWMPREESDLYNNRWPARANVRHETGRAAGAVPRSSVEEIGVITQFEDRERAFESYFKHELEMEFEIRAHRNRLLGLWAGGLMGFDADAAEAYAKDVIASDFQASGDAEVQKNVFADVQGKGVQTSEHLVRKKWINCWASRVTKERLPNRKDFYLRGAQPEPVNLLNGPACG